MLSTRFFQGFRRPAHSIFFLTAAKSFRLDTDRRGLPVAELEVFDFGCDKARKLVKTLPQMFEKAAPGRKVWVLFDGLDTELIGLPLLQIQDAAPEVIEQTLALEYETMADVAPGSSVVAFRDLGDEDGMRTYWTLAMPELVLDDLDRQIKRHGAKLAGILHPGALPAILEKTDSEPERWFRFEAWARQLLIVWKTPEQDVKLLQHPDGENWNAMAEQWLAEQDESFDRSETLLNNRLEYLPDTRIHWSLTDTDRVARWLSRWIFWLSQGKETGLLRKQSKIDQDLFYMSLSGGGALALCLIHAGVSYTLTEHYRTEADRLDGLNKQLTGYTSESGKNQQEITQIQQRLERQEQLAETLPKAGAALKQRWLGLLTALAEQTPDGVMIDRIGSQDKVLAIYGVTVRPDLADQLAVALQSRLEPLGWSVGAPSKTDLALIETGGPWDFSLPIEDLGMDGFNTERR